MLGLPWWLSGKKKKKKKIPPANEGDADSISGWEDPLEKETATYSSIVAWEIQRKDRGACWVIVYTEEPYMT